MTRLQLKSRILDNLKDPTSIYWTDSKLNDSIQDGYDEIVLETECIEQVTTVNFTPGLIYYDLYDLLTTPCYWKPTRLFNNQSNRWFQIYDQQILNKIYYSWELSNGNPWCAYIVNYRYLGFFPHGSPGTYDLFYKVCRDILINDSQFIQIPDSYVKVIENWCTADLLESVQEFSKASTYWTDYQTELDRFRSHVRARKLPVQRQILEPMQP